MQRIIAAITETYLEHNSTTNGITGPNQSFFIVDAVYWFRMDIHDC
jgi:hypothetical protein